MFKYKQYLITIDFDKENINDGIYLEIQDKIAGKYFSFVFTEKYLFENIKVIKKLEDLYNIIILGFNKEKNKHIKLDFINISDTLVINYNIYYETINFTIEFSLSLNLINKLETIIEDNDVKKELLDLKEKYNLLERKYKKIINEHYILDDIVSNTRYYAFSPLILKLNRKNKHFYLSVKNWNEPKLNAKYVKIIDDSAEYKVEQKKLSINSFDVKFINDRSNLYAFNNVNIKYDIKYLILNNTMLTYNRNFKFIHIKKYEINIDLNFFNTTFDKIELDYLTFEKLLQNITDYSHFILNNCTIDYLILNQDMHNFTNILKKDINANIEYMHCGGYGAYYIFNTMKILKGIILNNCIKLSKDKDLADYCKDNKLDLIIN